MRGFSITELLVVVGIIALLAAILLVALNRAQQSAQAMQTRTAMRAFAAACDAFYQDHGFYPGVVPEETFAAQSGPPPISTTESALLHLLGGYATPADWGQEAYDDLSPRWTTVTFTDGFELKINSRLIGEGPRINGRSYEPYMALDGGDIAFAEGEQVGVRENGFTEPFLPDLLDAWGQPIVYLRQVRDYGPLVSDGGELSRFVFAGISPYTESTQLGRLGESQVGTSRFSVLGSSGTSGGYDIRELNLAQLIRHPGFGLWDDDSGFSPGSIMEGTPRGAYVLFSAGPDGIYFSNTDGPGTLDTPIDDLTDQPAAALAEYDDVLVFGGG